MSKCSDCGTELTGVVYTEHCGPHGIDEFVRTFGYVVDVGDLYGDWEDPSTFIIPANRITGESPDPVYTTEKKCCYWAEIPDADDENWCPKCQDVMEPAK